jgi:branched-chain amino acid transport system ATP-binding protein
VKANAVLETRELSVRFGGHVAVDRVSCAFFPGTLSAIVGPNGAGKTTWFNAVSGQVRPSAGQVLLGGEDITSLAAPLRARRGLGRAFQLTQLFAQLSVHENVRLAVQAQAQQGLGLDALVQLWSARRDLIERTDVLLETVSLSSQRDQAAAALSHGDQRKLELAILMALQPRIFLLDEPTAGMSLDDVPVVLDLIRALKRRGDATILLVEHKMDVIHELADRILVLHEGRLVADGEPEQVMRSETVQQAYLGQAVQP